MPKLIDSLHAWKSDAFAQALKRDLLNLGSGVLPLHRGVSQGGIVDDRNMDMTVLQVGDDGPHIKVTMGVFFTEIVGGCSCGDDPMEASAYCEMEVRIDKDSAEAEFDVVRG